MQSAMIQSPQGHAMLTYYEGCKLVGYPDRGGVPTIGYGTTGKHIHIGQIITAQQASDMLAVDVGLIQDGLNANTIPQLTQGQFDALVCFAYNEGLPTLLHHSVLYAYVQRADWDLAVGEFNNWIYCHIDGVKTPLDDLKRRRAGEAAMFRTGEWVPN